MMSTYHRGDLLSLGRSHNLLKTISDAPQTWRAQTKWSMEARVSGDPRASFRRNVLHLFRSFHLGRTQLIRTAYSLCVRAHTVVITKEYGECVWLRLQKIDAKLFPLPVGEIGRVCQSQFANKYVRVHATREPHSVRCTRNPYPAFPTIYNHKSYSFGFPS